MFNLSPEALVIRLVVIAVFLLVAFPIHEAAHAYAAYRMGDSTARYFGRLTLDPTKHFDPVGGLLLAITILFSGGGFGWAKPTPVNPLNLRGRYGDAIVAAAGPLSNLALAILGAIVFRVVFFGLQMEGFLPAVAYSFTVINLFLMVFNLIPIPPLDGSHVLYAFLDPRTERQVRPVLDQYGFIILFVLAFFPLVNGGSLLSILLGPVLDPLIKLLLGL